MERRAWNTEHGPASTYTNEKESDITKLTTVLNELMRKATGILAFLGVG
jgi:hypothetical protein